MTALLAADSWLVADGRARAAERHWARFSATCREHGVEPAALTAFRAWVKGRCRGRGAGFRASSCARTAVSSPSRSARRRRASRRSWRGSPTCPTRAAPRDRRVPTSSGSGQLRERAAAYGAGEAVIAVAAEGRLIEGAYTSLLWWEGKTLCVVAEDADPPRDHPGAADRARA